MKRLSTLLMAAALFAAPSVQAQKVEDFGYFDHLSAGVTLGVLDGIGLELAAPIGNYVQMRAGAAFMPTTTVYDRDIEYRYGKPSKDAKVTAEANIGWVNGKMLFDVYPFRSNAFRITAGLYFGTNAIAKAHNTSDVLTEGEGVIIGQKYLFPDDNKNIKIDARINSVKPYIGIGYGRAVPKSRVSVGFDLGVLFWGKPEGWIYGKNADTGVTEWSRIRKEEFDPVEDEDIIDAFDIIEKFKFGPVLNIRVGVRIF